MSRIADYSRDFWIALGLVVAFYLLRAAVRAVVRFARRRRDRRPARERSPTVLALDAMFKARFSDAEVARLATRDHVLFDAVAKRTEQPPPPRYTFRVPFDAPAPSGTLPAKADGHVFVGETRTYPPSAHDPGDEDER